MPGEREVSFFLWEEDFFDFLLSLELASSSADSSPLEVQTS
jgi:hypothetical protein